MLYVKSLHIYPVKGCKGIDVNKAAVKPTGLAYDRRWAIVKKENHYFQSQKQIEAMALIETELPLDLLTGDREAVIENDYLELKAPNMPTYKLPILDQNEKTNNEITVLKWTGMAQDEGDEVAQWLSSFLNSEVRLFKYVGSYVDKERVPFIRYADPNYAKEAEVAFADGFPYLIANEASMEDLNNRLEKKIKINRFRANIIIEGAEAWEEDKWKIIETDGEMSFEIVKACSRCIVTTVDQETGEVGVEPLETLGKFRKGSEIERVALNMKSKVFFGWNAITKDYGIINVGDRLNIRC